MRKILISVLMIAISSLVMAMDHVANYRVVPIPNSIEYLKGKAFVLNNGTSIYYNGGERMKRNAEFLRRYIEESIGMKLQVTNKKSKDHQIQLLLNKDSRKAHVAQLKTEAYSLIINDKKVMIMGASEAGVFYGIQTLRKSLPLEQGNVTLPAINITDEPRFEWRGMQLDCARHFFSADFVKKFIDILALHNMNTFHWHLTDDQGWRLEQKRHPELTKIGAVRSGTVIGNNSDVDDGIPYGGFYTRQQVREIVEYAKERYIKVIPEIDVPGHAMAILAAHPELGCTGGPYHVGHKWGVYNDVLCVGNPATYELMKDILDEVMELFPSETIHIGGDETPTVRWQQCTKCKILASPQGYFTKKITDYLEQKGHYAVCWDESLEKGIDQQTMIMSWRGTKPGIKAAEMGHDVIMTPLTHCYFDYYQTEKSNYEPSITGMWPISVEKVYSLEPVADSLSVEVRNHIKGVQANVWTEQIGSSRVVEYMVLPRIGALSEVAWTQPQHKNFNDYLKRQTRLATLYDYFGWQYAKHLWPEKMVKDRWKIDN